jgi:VWFA-related protein
MSRCSRGIVFFLAVALAAAFAQDSGAPQLQPRPAEPNAPAHASPAKQIFLDVQVTDKYGAQVRGLQKQDFTLLDDKEPHEILSFEAVDTAASGDAGIEVVLVIDAINAGFNAVARERDQVKKFLLQDGGKLPVPMSLMIFSDKGMEVQKATRDGNALATEYEQYETGLRTINRSQGIYGAEERFEKSLKTIHSLTVYEATRPGRKLVIWISPGWPLLSTPRIHLTDKDEEHFFAMIVAASAELRQARVTLYVVDPLGLPDFRRARYFEEFVKGVKSPRNALPGNLGLQVLAVQTGGLVLNTTNDLTTAVATCAADATSYYVLSFAPKRADQANEYHSVKINIDKPGLNARTRTGYYNQP